MKKIKYFIPLAVIVLLPYFWHFMSSNLSWLTPDVGLQSVIAAFVVAVGGLISFGMLQ